MLGKIHYRFLIIGTLLISLIASNINSSKMNLLGINLSFNFGIFKTTLIYLFLLTAIFIAIIFLLNQKFINKKIIALLLVLYTFYLIACLAIAFIENQEMTMWIVTIPFYPLFGLLFLAKNWDFDSNMAYLLNKIKIFIYLAILIGAAALIARRECQFLDLLSISLLFLSYELFERKNNKAFLIIIALAIVSGFNLTWLFTFLSLAAMAVFYYFKHFNIRKVIFIPLIFILAVCIYFFSGLPTSLRNSFKLPPEERFTQSELLRSTGRLALWEKYIFQYNGNFFELLFGHGSAFVYTVAYNDTTFTVGHLHNIFFDEFYKRGIAGLLLFISIIAISLKARAPNYLKVFLILLLIEGQSNLNIFDGATGIFFWATIGMLNNAHKEPQDAKNTISNLTKTA